MVNILDVSKPESYAGLLAEIGLAPGDLLVADMRYPVRSESPAIDRLLSVRRKDAPAGVLISLAGLGSNFERTSAAVGNRLLAVLPAGGVFVLHGREGEELAQWARWRAALWPRLHATAWYVAGPAGVERRTLQGKQPLAGVALPEGHYLVFRERAEVMSPRSTVEKFDQNAKGWDGDPDSPSYAHHRWMRRFVAHYAPAPRGARVLDFGSGAGWCGIEAALRCGAQQLCAFDPSPQMVQIAERNARAAGIADFRGKPGFGEAPPFAGPGEAPFDLVISSGVISFVPAVEPWLDGLLGCLKPGGTLIIGDLDPRSLGMQRRRRKKVLLPIRELNARGPQEVRAWLEQRGLVFERGSGYQLSWPVPQAMEFSERRLGGLLHRPLLWANQAAAAADRGLGGRLAGLFDSWVMAFRRPAR